MTTTHIKTTRPGGGALLLGLALLLGPGQAAAGEGPGQLTMERAVALALSRAPEARAAGHQVAASKARARQSRAIYWPRASLEAGYLARWPQNELPIDLSALQNILGDKAPSIEPIDDVHHVRAGLSVGMRLFDLSGWARTDAADAALGAEEEGERLTRARLAFRVRASYLAVLLTGEVARIAGESLSVARAEEKRARLRLEVGTGTELSLAGVRMRLAELSAQKRRAELEHQRQQQRLATLLGVKTLPALGGSLQALSGAPPESPTEQNPEVRRARALQRAAEAQVSVQKRAFAPTLGFIARAEVEYPHQMRLQWGPLLTAGVQLSWTFFDGLLTQGRTAEAEARARAARSMVDAEEEQLRRTRLDLAARRRTATAALDAAKKSEEQAKVYLRVARAAEQAGTGTRLETNTAELGLDRARVAVQQALFELALVRAEALMVAGRGAGEGPQPGTAGQGEKR